MKNYIVRRNGRAEDFFGDVFNDFFKPVFYDEKAEGMKTDIRETDTHYEMEVEMPGFDKKDISVSFNDGYITVSANKEEKEENEKDGKKYLFLHAQLLCRRSRRKGNQSQIRKRRSDGEHPQRTAETDRKAYHQHRLTSYLLDKRGARKGAPFVVYPKTPRLPRGFRDTI